MNLYFNGHHEIPNQFSCWSIILKLMAKPKQSIDLLVKTMSIINKVVTSLSMS